MALITTTKGLMPEEALRAVHGELDNDHEHTRWVEFYDDDELVHRSVHVHLKTPLPGLEPIIAVLGE